MRYMTQTLDCNPLEYKSKDVIIFNNKDLFIKSKKLTVQSSEYTKTDDKIFICPHFVNSSREYEPLNCTEKFGYEIHEYQILHNGSAVVQGEIIQPEDYMFKNNELLTCATDYADIDDDFSSQLSLRQVSIYVGQVGSFISILALIIHLVTFCFLPALRNLPGYNLASLSIAFLLAYSFLLIGQIPQVLGLFCVISGVLQQNFFLAAFFCMNVLAFDVWRTLRLATEKLAVGSQNTRKRQFLWYALYAWGCPLLISLISVIIDNCDNVPESIKPDYGKDDICWLSNTTAKTIFFSAPAFILILINGVFFIRSSWMISSNTMKLTNDQSKQTVTINYVLYVRLGIMMGLTWLIGVLAVIFNNAIVWFGFDLFNSLQGLFLFLLFTCTRKVMKHLRQKTVSKKSASDKHSTLTSNSSQFNSKH